MSRLALLALLAVPAVAPAQGFSLPYRTGSTFYQPSFGRYPGGFYGGFNPVFRVPYGVPYGGIGYLSPGGYYDPGFFTTYGSSVYYIPSYAGPVMPSATPVAPPLAGAGTPTKQPAVTAPAVVAATAARPAELTLELPGTADVWVDGKQQPGRDAARTLTSAPLAVGSTHTFNLKAAWTGADGSKYEWERAVSVAAGAHSKVTVAAGFKAKD